MYVVYVYIVYCILYIVYCIFYFNLYSIFKWPMLVGGNIYLWKGLHDGMRDFEHLRLCQVVRGG